MELTRRDAVAVLASLGIGTTAVGRSAGPATEVEEITAVLLAVTDVIYPTAVDVDEAFITTYVLGGFHARSGYRRRVTRAVTALDDRARRRYGEPFSALDAERRRAVLRHLGVDRSHSNPTGTLAERIHYYVIDDLLYALYTTPTGGELIGMENPPGYPGGTQAYRRGPEG